MYNKRYPIGQFEKPEIISSNLISEWISIIAAFPESLGKEVKSLSDEQLDTPYRDGGWSLRQVVHHCADSHMNAFCRIKLALTEDSPAIKPYFEEIGMYAWHCRHHLAHIITLKSTEYWE